MLLLSGGMVEVEVVAVMVEGGRCCGEGNEVR